MTFLGLLCLYTPCLWHELPDNIKAADSVQNLKMPSPPIILKAL